MLWGFIPKDRWPQAIPVLKSLLEALGHSDVSTTIELLSGQDS